MLYNVTAPVTPAPRAQKNYHYNGKDSNTMQGRIDRDNPQKRPFGYYRKSGCSSLKENDGKAHDDEDGDDIYQNHLDLSARGFLFIGAAVQLPG